jgi:3-deoxy-D-manno-octulosonic-acid transferase
MARGALREATEVGHKVSRTARSAVRTGALRPRVARTDLLLLTGLVLYNLLQALLSPWLVARFVRRVFVRRKDHVGWPRRLALRPPLSPEQATRFRAASPRVWLFCRSLGEYRAALPFLRAFLERRPEAAIVVFATTAEVAPTVAETLPEARVFPAALPYDWIVPALAHTRALPPDLVLFVESFWYPNLLPLVRLRGARTAVLNLTVKPISFRHTRAWTFRHWLRHAIDLICVQADADVGALARLGVSPADLCVAGNAKFDTPVTRLNATERHAQRAHWSVRGPLLVAGSTHEGEEEIILDAFSRVCARIDSQLILAPRYPRRAPEIAEMARARGLRCILRSALRTVDSYQLTVNSEEGHPSQLSTANCQLSTVLWDVLVLDTMGELAGLYPLADAAFVGGSLAPVGGHSLIESVAAGVWTVFGPHVAAFRAVAEDAVAAGVAAFVTDAASLADEWLSVVTDPARQETIAARALDLLQRSRGATEQWLETADRLLEGARPTV